MALYDYDTEDRLGEDGNLSFFEGEIIEVRLWQIHYEIKKIKLVYNTHELHGVLAVICHFMFYR